MSEGPVDVGGSPDPVAAFLQAHDRGRPVVLRTSGSAGRPRSVVRSTTSWVDSFPHVAALTRLAAADRLWLPGPIASTMTLFAAVLARCTDAEVVSAPDGATHAHLTPLMLAGALDAGVRLDGVEVTVAGDRLELPLHDRAVAAGARVSHYYGASELSFVAWGQHAGALRPFPGVEVEPRPAPQREPAEIWVRSEYLCSGYLDDAPGPLRTDRAGFATVGDRGTVTDDGLVVVAGRGEDAVTTGGATVHLTDVEQALGPAVLGQVAVVGLPHATLGQVVAVALTEAADHPRAWAAARRELSVAQRPRVWYAVARLPVTSAGKIDRLALAALLRTGAARRLAGSGQRRPLR